MSEPPVSYANKATSDYMRGGESFTAFGATVECLGMEGNDDGSGYRMGVKLHFPWGNTIRDQMWEGSWWWAEVHINDEPYTNDDGIELYSGQHPESDYWERCLFYCTSGADFSGLSDDQIKVRIEQELDMVDRYFVDRRFGIGNDNNKGVNWDEPWRSINKAATTVPNGKEVHIACGYDGSIDAEFIGDHYRIPGYDNQITPVNAGFPGITYVLDDPRDLTENAQYAACFGTFSWDIPLKHTVFSHEPWGEYLGGFLWKDDGSGFLGSGLHGAHGFYASRCSFVDSDVFLDDYHHMPKLIDDNIETELYTGSSLLLENGWNLQFMDLGADNESCLCRLEKDGTLIDEPIVHQNTTYVHTENFDNVDVPIIVVGIKDIFSGTETNAVVVQGIFQLKDEIWDYTPPE